MNKDIYYYDNHWAIKPFYIRNTSIELDSIPNDASILMVGMGGLFYPTIKPECKFTVIEYSSDIIEKYKHRLNNNIKLIKGDAYDKDLIEGLNNHDYIFFDIWTSKQDISVLNELRDMYKTITTEDKMFHLKSIFK